MELRGRIRGRRGRGEEGYGEGEGGWEEEERITDSKINAVYNGPVLNYLSNYPFSLIPLSLVSLFALFIIVHPRPHLIVPRHSFFIFNKNSPIIPQVHLLSSLLTH